MEPTEIKINKPFCLIEQKATIIVERFEFKNSKLKTNRILTDEQWQDEEIKINYELTNQIQLHS